MRAGTRCSRSAQRRSSVCLPALPCAHPADTCAGASRRLDATAATAVAASALVILSTIHTQDFADVAGDAELGRRTLPLRFPALARWITLAALPAWSALLARFWALGPACAAVFVCLGAATAAGFFCWRGERADRRSFGMYTVSESRILCVRTR